MAASIKAWENEASYFHFAGHQFAYWRAGSGPVLLLVHGFPTSSWDWLPIWSDLAKIRTVIACDLLGFGLSDKPAGGFYGKGYHLVDQADALEALLEDELAIQHYDAVVHDYGVSAGQELLARQQEQSGAAGLGQMIFLNGGIFPDQHRPLPIQTLGMSPWGILVSRLMNRTRFARSFTKVFGPASKPSEAEMDAYWHFIQHADGHRRTHELLRYIADRRCHGARWVASLKPAAGRIDLINGALDPVSGEHAYRRWRDYLPEARHGLLDDVGHYPHVEAPARVLAQLLEWLDEEHR